jgi:hypothetical protein
MKVQTNFKLQKASVNVNGQIGLRQLSMPHTDRIVLSFDFFGFPKKFKSD